MQKDSNHRDAWLLIVIYYRNGSRRQLIGTVYRVLTFTLQTCQNHGGLVVKKLQLANSVILVKHTNDFISLT